MGLPTRSVAFGETNKSSPTYVEWDNILYRPELFPPMQHNHNLEYYTKEQVDELVSNSGGGGTSPITWESILNRPELFPPTQHNHDDMYYTKVKTDDKLRVKANANHNHDSKYATVEDFGIAIVGLSIQGDKLIATRKNGTTIQLTLPTGGGGETGDNFSINASELVATITGSAFKFIDRGEITITFLKPCTVTLNMTAQGSGYYMISTSLNGAHGTIEWTRELKSYEFVGQIGDTIIVRTDTPNWEGTLQ